MNTQKYDARLPALRCSSVIEEKLLNFADKHHISLAAAMRLALARGLDIELTRKRARVSGQTSKDKTIHYYQKAA